MHRFFVPSDSLKGNQATIRDLQAHQIAHVLRMQPGDVVILLDNSGWEIETRLVSVQGHVVTGEVLHRRLATGEPRTKISLYQGVLRNKNFELVLQKGTELGMVEFVPVIAERCVVSDLESVGKKRRRWEWIIQEAAEQCRRGRKPVLRPPILFPRACEEARQSGGLSLVPWEEEHKVGLQEVLRAAPRGTGGDARTGDRQSARPERREGRWLPFSINLFVGPEGGFTLEEIVLARRYGLQPITLGPRILRAETAGLVVAAAVLYELGDLR
jgi:16S rRNA (uracil1498-N3)-methyltransferase